MKRSASVAVNYNGGLISGISFINDISLNSSHKFIAFLNFMSYI